jgi:hypothetical protein
VSATAGRCLTTNAVTVNGEEEGENTALNISIYFGSIPTARTILVLHRFCTTADFPVVGFADLGGTFTTAVSNILKHKLLR